MYLTFDVLIGFQIDLFFSHICLFVRGTLLQYGLFILSHVAMMRLKNVNDVFK